MSVTQYDPNDFLVTFHRALNTYVKGFVGDDPYEIVMGYPGVQQLQRKVPLSETLIHFEVDDMQQVFFGFGDNVVNVVQDEAGHTVSEWEAHCHVVTMDVGVWASAESGGVTARLRARQLLDNLFNGPNARDVMMAATNGLEILSFRGGRNLVDVIGDIDVWRMVDVELRIRMFSRTIIGPTTRIEVITQGQGVEIDDQVIVG